MGEDGLTDGAGPHPEGGGELRGLWVAGEVLPEGALVDIVLPADGAGVVGSSPFRHVRATGHVGERHCRHKHI